MRILLIEDDENLCDSLGFQLQKEGFTVDICYDGEDGLHLFSFRIRFWNTLHSSNVESKLYCKQSILKSI